MNAEPVKTLCSTTKIRTPSERYQELTQLSRRIRVRCQYLPVLVDLEVGDAVSDRGADTCGVPKVGYLR